MSFDKKKVTIAPVVLRWEEVDLTVTESYVVTAYSEAGWGDNRSRFFDDEEAAKEYMRTFSQAEWQEYNPRLNYCVEFSPLSLEIPFPTPALLEAAKIYKENQNNVNTVKERKEEWRSLGI